MNAGLLLTVWTIRLALLLLTAEVIAALVWRDAGRWATTRRLLWSTGCLLATLHVATALLLVHEGSWARAYRHTAEQTRQQIGWEFGGGIYFNLAFVAVWCLDATWWWLAPGSYRRRGPVLTAATMGFLLFIAFNATVVFEDGPVRLAGLVATALLAPLLALRIRSGKPAP